MTLPDPRPSCSRLWVVISVASTLLVSVSAAQAEGPPHAVVAGGSLDGEVLLGELNCLACHAAPEHARRLSAKQSPVLSDVASRVTPQYLQELLASPQRAKPGTPMPDMLHGMPENVRRQTAGEMLHFLSSLGTPLDQRGAGTTSFEIGQGQRLFHRVGCVACHEPIDPPPVSKDAGLPDDEIDDENGPDGPTATGPAELRSSIPLGQLDRKTTVDALAQFLLNPLHVRPSGRMPNLKLAPREARAIAAYLLRDQLRVNEQGWAAGLDVEVYRGAINKSTDINGRKPDWKGTADQLEMAAVEKQNEKLNNNFAVRFHGAIEIKSAGVYRFWTKSDDGSVLRIDGKTVVDNDGIHAPMEKSGQVELPAGRYGFEVVFFQGGGPYELTVRWQPPGEKKPAPIPATMLLHGSAAMIPLGELDLAVDPQKAERGKAAFARLGCAACHQTDQLRTENVSVGGRGKALEVLSVDADSGCLSEHVAAGRPRFALSGEQRKALAGAITKLQAEPAPLTVEQQIDRHMTTLGCVACHRRDGRGGPDPRREKYFTTTMEVDLGDEGRLPPAINEIGVKFSPRGMRGILLEGWTMRPHMATRMPQFGKAALAGLPELFAAADTNKVPRWTPEFTSKMVDDGRTLVGKGALGCVNCHAWNGQKIQGADGLDLVDMTNRISPGWFHALLTDPQQLKPRTRMPTAWPNGKSFFPKIQGGDADRQIDAIWAYLSMGAKGGTPAGLSPEDGLLLVPEDEPIVFRTFAQGVGAHAIAVGFRQRAHLAFDALGVRTARVWAGDFISARPAWEGRAGQYAAPEGPAVELPAAPAFARLDSQADAWPEFDPKQKTPPAGYKFRGYRFDAQRVPTFLYDFGDVAIEETPSTDYRQSGSLIIRTLRLSSPRDVPQLWFRAATGPSIEELADGTFRVGETAQFTIRVDPAAKTVVRKIGDMAELLVPITLAKNDGRFEAVLEVEVLW